LERSIAARYAFACALIAIATSVHWLLFPFTQSRIPFLLFIPAIILATAAAGRGPGLLVVLAGAINGSLQLTPTGSPWIDRPMDRVSLLAFVLTGLFLVFIGYRLRTVARREYDDLHELHELSAALVSVADLKQQLALILQTLVRVHGVERGQIALYDAPSDSMRVAASVGDATAQPRFEHSTSVLSRNGALLGKVAVFFATPRRPTPREISLADICARKAAVSIERATAEELAQRREQRFRTVLESSAVSFAILEPVRNESDAIIDFRWRYLNSAAARVTGRTREELVGRRVSEVMPDVWEETGMLPIYASVVETQTPCERELHIASNGIDGWFQLVASPLEGKVAAWFTDITERKRHEESLREADRRKDEFLATLAHELRNPLAPIRQAVLVAASERASDVQKRWAYAVIERQVQHMSLLLDDLLDLSRITRGALSLRKQQVDLQEVVGAAVETARPLIEERHHQLVVDIPDALQFSCDPLRLSQVFANLLTNAAKYTPPGGAIRIVCERQERTVLVRVEDNGVGLSAEDVPRIFQMFTQAGASQGHTEGGLGIGLALTKGLVEMHGGGIQVQSAGSGHGCVFTVRLPIGEVVRAAPAARVEEHDARLNVARRVLVADDNRDGAETLATVLRLEGHDVAVAHDGPAALLMFERHQPDVALLDIGMPQLDGYEVARRIRARADGAHVLLVAVTGWGQEKDRRQSAAAGFDYHLTKPVEPDVLIRLIQPLATGKVASA
jgi:PAS domain S-box-containing protein